MLSCNVKTKEDNKEYLALYLNEKKNEVILKINNQLTLFQMGQVRSDFNKNELDLSDWTKSKFLYNTIEKFEFDSICMTWNELQFKNKYIITEDSVFFEYMDTENNKIQISKIINNDKNYAKFLGLFVIKFFRFDINKLIDESSKNDIVFSIKTKNINWKIYNFTVNNIFEIHTFYCLFDYHFSILNNIKKNI
jgi:hypothetical protein